MPFDVASGTIKRSLIKLSMAEMSTVEFNSGGYTIQGIQNNRKNSLSLNHSISILQ